MLLRLALALLSGLLASSSIQAQTRYLSGPSGQTMVNRVGNTDYYYLPDGRTFSVDRVGKTSFVYGPDGQAGTISRVGPTTFYNGPGSMTGSSHRFGKTTQYGFSDGVYGSATSRGRYTDYSFYGPGGEVSFGTIQSTAPTFGPPLVPNVSIGVP